MKNGFKKFMLIAMALVVSVGICACGEKDTKDTSADELNAAVEQQTQKPEESKAEEDKIEEKETPAPTKEAKKETAATKKPAQQTPTPKAQTPAPTPKATPTPTPTPTPQPTKAAPAPTADRAAAYIGSSTASLVAAIGQPNSKSYASSCIGDGQDGEWYYNGFTVYTYKDVDGSETVQDVF